MKTLLSRFDSRAFCCSLAYPNRTFLPPGSQETPAFVGPARGIMVDKQYRQKANGSESSATGTIPERDRRIQAEVQGSQRFRSRTRAFRSAQALVGPGNPSDQFSSSQRLQELADRQELKNDCSFDGRNFVSERKTSMKNLKARTDSIRRHGIPRTPFV